jgi:hypothetical protein
MNFSQIILEMAEITALGTFPFTSWNSADEMDVTSMLSVEESQGKDRLPLGRICGCHRVHSLPQFDPSEVLRSFTF